MDVRSKPLLVGALIFWVLSAIAPAQAFKAGDYKGDTQSERRVSFTVSKSEVAAFKIKVRYGCTDFDSFWTREKGFPSVKVGDDGKFSARFTNSDGSYTSKLKGTLTGRTAKGNFSAKRTYNAEGELDPKGKVTCYVRKTKWTAKKEDALS
jgi:hypothetical protein